MFQEGLRIPTTPARREPLCCAIGGLCPPRPIPRSPSSCESKTDGVSQNEAIMCGASPPGSLVGGRRCDWRNCRGRSLHLRSNCQPQKAVNALGHEARIWRHGDGRCSECGSVCDNPVSSSAHAARSRRNPRWTNCRLTGQPVRRAQVSPQRDAIRVVR
jgi:hypothetical protein